MVLFVFFPVFFRYSVLLPLFLSQDTSYSTLHRRLCENHFKRHNLEKKGCEITVNLTLVGAMSVRTAPSLPLFSSFYTTQNVATFLPFKWFQTHGEDKVFCFSSLCVFFFPVWYRIPGMRLHIRPDHNYLLLTGELCVFHLKSEFTIRCRVEVGGG